MIKQISRKNLNIEKYSKCLEESVNYRIYAEFWYLDIVANKNWDCLVLNDYEAIMPLPFSRKFIVKMILQPFFCQQLGVFHRENFTKENFSQFEKKLHKKIVRSYQYNEENTEMFSPKGEKKVNQILDFMDIENPKNLFAKDRLKDIRRIEKENYIINKSIDIEKFIEIFKKNYVELNTKYKLNESVIRDLLTIVHKNNKLIQNNLIINNKTVCISLYLKSNNRNILLFSSREKTLEIKGSFAFLLAHKFINETEYIYDFEGSNIQNIQKFNSSFGAEKKTYTSFSSFQK